MARMIPLAAGVALALGVAPATAQVQGVTAGELLIGSTMDLTGPVSAIGIPLKSSLEVAADKLNEAGGVHGRKVRVVVEDDGYDPKRAVLAVQKLIGRDAVFAVVGVLGSAITQITTPIVTDKGLPMLFAAAPTRATFDPARKLSFALVPAYDLGMSAATAYAHDTLGKRRFCMMYQDDESGETSLAGVEQRLKTYGLPLLEKTTCKRGATDFSAQFARMRGANCDAVVLGTIVREAAAAAIGLVNACHADPEALHRAVGALAAEIAAKSPLAIRGTKEMITYVRDRPVADALNYVATWNAALLLSADLDEALAASREKRQARFED